MRQNKIQKFNKLTPWIIWLLAACFYCYQYFLQVSPSVMVKDLMHSFHINAAALSFLASLYFWTYAAMQLPVGVMLDKIGARRLLTACAATVAIGAILFASSQTFYLVAIGRLLIGLGASSASIGCIYIAAIHHPAKRFSLLTGLLLTIGMLGAIGGQAPLAYLVHTFGWRLTLFIFGTIGIGLAILIFIFIKDKPAANSNNQHTTTKLLHGLKIVSKSKQTWAAALHAGLMFIPTSVFGALWGVPFISSKYNLSTTLAAAFISMLFVGWAIGAPIFGWLSDYFKKRNVFMYISAIGALAAMNIIIYMPPIPHLLLSSTIFALGFFSSGLILAFTVAKEINPPNITGAAMGFMNAINMIGGAIIPPIIGIILDCYNKTVTAHAIHLYSIKSYEISLTILPAALFISLIFLFFIKETNAISHHE